MSEEAIYQALRVENTRCEVALSDDEVRAIAHSVSSYQSVIEVNEGTSFTDVANAKRLVLASGDQIRFCNEEGAEGRWFIFDGKRWASSTQNRVMPFVTDLAIKLYESAAVEPDADKRRRLSTEAQRLESARCVRNVIDIAKSRPELRVEPRDFDQDQHLLNVENGVLDLQTSTLLPHDPKYFITKLAPVAYDPEARSELWEKTVELAACGDVTLLAFLRRTFGLTLTGYTNENVFFVLYGPTRSGKTTVVTAVSTMLGDYATTLRVQAILAGGGVDKIPHDLADLRGARLVVTSETPKGKRYDENTIKMLTGGDEVKACFKYGHNFSYYPSLKLFMYTNYRPEFSGGDDAIWARALTVPFLFNFKTYEGHDREAKDRLREPDARAAVLAWAVRGWQSYQKDGLLIPARVTDETAKHRKEVDSVQNFLDERCETVGTEVLERRLWVTNRVLSQAYQRWSKERSNPERMSEAVLVAEMTRLGYRHVTVTINHNRSLRYEGLRLRGDRE